jgi:hypothetical protein
MRREPATQYFTGHGLTVHRLSCATSRWRPIREAIRRRAILHLSDRPPHRIDPNFATESVLTQRSATVNIPIVRVRDLHADRRPPLSDPS